jgi:four helix bundle protein
LQAKVELLFICGMFTFEKLEVWKESVDFANDIYLLTRKFPTDEKFGLSTQMRRAAVSVSSNLAEGSSRSSRDDFARFVEMASGSLFEIVSQLVLCSRQGLIRQQEYERLYATAERQAKMLNRLRTVLKK